MAYIYSKGWYVLELKKMGIRSLNDRKLESYKTHILANLYREKVAKKDISRF